VCGPTDRAAVYQQLGITLTYRPATNLIEATADLARVARGVGGATAPPATARRSSI